ncbi:hypothetical protein KCP69_04635 [Salmonella enterica subsp. enterica]|nr:hypothetical protein KCP69_04635 [Salmonella enterica subsp. enterica]
MDTCRYQHFRQNCQAVARTAPPLPVAACITKSTCWRRRGGRAMPYVKGCRRRLRWAICAGQRTGWRWRFRGCRLVGLRGQDDVRTS